MKKKTFKAVRIGIFLLLLLFIIIIFNDNIRISRKWLKRKEVVKSDIFVCDGWLPEHNIDTLIKLLNKNEYKAILITGKKQPNHVTLYHNGYIIIKNIFSSDKENTVIELSLKGTKVEDIYPHCNIYYNDSLIDKKILKKRNTKLKFLIHGLPKDSLSIEFTNDFHKEYMDRNIILSKVKIDNQNIGLHSENIWLKYKGRYMNTSAKSYSERLAQFLKLNQIPSEKIFTHVTSKNGISKTYNTASEAIAWLKSKGYHSANIITADYHSRRTYLSFKKVDPNYTIGVIPLPDRSNLSRTKYKIRTIKEFMGSVFIKFTPKFILEI